VHTRPVSGRRVAGNDRNLYSTSLGAKTATVKLTVTGGIRRILTLQSPGGLATIEIPLGSDSLRMAAMLGRVTVTRLPRRRERATPAQ
jgi:hypothetical protein